MVVCYFWYVTVTNLCHCNKFSLSNQQITFYSDSKSSLWTYFDEMLHEHNSEAPHSTPTVEAVVDSYLQEPVSTRKSDYWKQRQSQ